jgi:twitching motility protein PilT
MAARSGSNAARAPLNGKEIMGMEKKNEVAASDPNRAGAESLERVLRECVRRQASDLHLSTGRVPYLRIEGELNAQPQLGALNEECMESIVQAITAQMDAGDALKRTGSVDGSYSLRDGPRFRFNVFRCQGRWNIAFRQLEERFRSLEELGLPSTLYHFCDLRDGLVIVAGPSGNGKTTTMATLLDHINRNRKGRIITIEDPVEYLHTPIQSMVDQRQVGVDAPSFNDALVSALREDADVIYVGESRDLNTIRTAITAAETGHLVFTTAHSGEAVAAIERMVMPFTVEEQPSIRTQLAMVLRAVVVQHLLPAADSGARATGAKSKEPPAPKRRVAACEIIVNTPAVAHCIATAQSRQINGFIEAGRSYGMQKFEQDVGRLLAAQKITSATAAMATLKRSARVSA